MRLAKSALITVLALAGCSNPNDPASDLLKASAANKTLTITNTSSGPVYYFVADKELLALLDWAVCMDPVQSYCKSIGAGESKRIAYSEFLATGSSGSQAVVYHWRLIPTTPGKYNYDSLRTLEVDLR